MATPVMATADRATSTAAVSSFECGFVGTPTVGNLLVAVYGARDEGNNASPEFTLTPGWEVVGVAAPMEFHTVGIAFRPADGTVTDDAVTVTPTTGDVQYWWCGVIEFNEAGVTDWTVDASSFNGSGATNVSNIATGSTGALSAATGVAVIVGTSRTGSEDLSIDIGAAFTEPGFVADAGAANYIAQWLDLTTTAALDATVTEGSGASRMGAGIAVFVEDGVGPTVPEGSVAGAITWTGTADGATEPAGTATGSTTWTGTADGSTSHEGTISGAIEWAGTAAGIAPPVDEATGTISGNTTWTSTASGAAEHYGTASSAITWTGSATGETPDVDPATGSITGATTWTATATGQATHTGTISGSVTWTGSAVGQSSYVVAPARRTARVPGMVRSVHVADQVRTVRV